MSGQHTPGRLEAMAVAGNDFGVRGPYILAVVDPLRAKIVGVAGELTEQDARRLAACWNACEGLTTDNLESVLFLGDTLRGRVEGLKAEADHANTELASARALLREAVLCLPPYNLCAPSQELKDRIRSYLDACDTLGGGG